MDAYYCSNQTWTEGTITWNNAPFSSCNKTVGYIKNTFGLQGTWICWDTTSIAQNAVRNSNKNITIWFNTSQAIGAVRDTYLASKEDPSGRYLGLNITYHELVSSTTTYQTTTTIRQESSTTTYETTTTQSTTTTVKVCPSPTGKCCFIGDVSGNCCLDSNFLYEQKIYDVNGTTYKYNETTFCSNGCDSVTNTCQPPEGMTIIYILVGIAIFGVIWMVVKRWFS
jgi:hypothetical protein